MPRVIDLTLTLQHGMRGVQFEQLHTVAANGWNSRVLHLYSHCGTNLAALQRDRVYFGAVPLKIAGGDGSPRRSTLHAPSPSRLLAFLFQTVV